MSRRLFEVGGTNVQAESEVAAINMVYGAAGAGARAMTSSSSPGISLNQEGISSICCSRLPCVIVNMVRGGPGLGGIQPAQSDYFQATKGGGHGDYHMLVYGPASVQECVNIMYDAFDKADKYRVPVMILGDGMLGQIMEPVELPEFKDLSKLPRKNWATYGDGTGEKRNIINSLLIEPDELEAHNKLLADTYAEHENRCAMISGLYRTGAARFSAFCFALAREGMEAPDGSCYFAPWDVVLLFFELKEGGEFGAVATVPLRLVNFYDPKKLKAFAETLEDQWKA